MHLLFLIIVFIQNRKHCQYNVHLALFRLSRVNIVQVHLGIFTGEAKYKPQGHLKGTFNDGRSIVYVIAYKTTDKNVII